ncbi:MAG: 50S ribosomal protein L29 [Rickettsiales bacterium]|jgi:large subunit ribosomal protein L29|nr:50S ribosomal protein L29 [Rickettsiales bacterium]
MAKKETNKTEKLDLAALGSKLTELKKEQMNLRFQKTAGQLAGTHLIRKTRRDIARAATEISAIKKAAKKGGK